MSEGYDIEVKLLAVTGLPQELGGAPQTAPSEQLIEYAGRLCWDSTDKMGTIPHRIAEWIEVGHESIIEHASASFYIRASRVLTHELVRHRLASYSQRSQRYCKETEPRYILPPEVEERAGQDGLKAYRKAMDDAWEAYKKLLDMGVKAEIARYVLPGSCETQVVMTMNFREIRHFIKLRAGRRALPEIRALAEEIRRIMARLAPNVFGDL